MMDDALHAEFSAGLQAALGEFIDAPLDETKILSIETVAEQYRNIWLWDHPDWVARGEVRVDTGQFPHIHVSCDVITRQHAAALDAQAYASAQRQIRDADRLAEWDRQQRLANMRRRLRKLVRRGHKARLGQGARSIFDDLTDAQQYALLNTCPRIPLPSPA